MVTTMRASSPADLVAAVAMLQVVPTSSLCVLPTERDRQGGDARVPGAMRWPVPVAEVAVGDMAGSVGYTGGAVRGSPGGGGGVRHPGAGPALGAGASRGG